jgi:hypothetical protein
MFKGLSYKQQLYYLLASGVLFFILAYWIAISKTLETGKNLKAVAKKLEQVKTAPENIATFEKRLAVINSKIGENLSDIPEFQKNLLDRISSYCAENSLVLKEFPQVHSWQKQDYLFITGYASIEGPFIPLLKLLYNLETTHSLGRIVSVDFSSREDRKLKRTRLTMSVYIQTIKQAKNDLSE